MNINNIAKYMIDKGTKNTCDFNYTFSIEEITNIFNIDAKEIYNKSEEILNTLESMEEVAECSLEADKFDLTFFTDYCRTIAFYQTQSEKTTKEFPFLYYISDCCFFNVIPELIITDKRRYGYRFDSYLRNYGMILCSESLSAYFKSVKRFDINQGLVNFKYLEYEELLKIAKELPAK